MSALAAPARAYDHIADADRWSPRPTVSVLPWAVAWTGMPAPVRTPNPVPEPMAEDDEYDGAEL